MGRKLAHLLIAKYEEEHGRIPENVAMYWMASDIMWADGEQLAQILFLLGVEPIWKGGRVKGYRVMSLEELGRPRIDVTVRASGITRDCFYNCIELLDQAIQEVAALDEPVEMNFVRKHTIGGDARRIFASRPGTYGNGVNLAVYASAWKEEERSNGRVHSVEQLRLRKGHFRSRIASSPGRAAQERRSDLQ